VIHPKLNSGMFFSLSPHTRTGRFLRTLSTSYILLVCATAYSLGVVPLILSYLSTSGLGLWTLIVQFAGYLTLLDAGLSSACIRQFVGPLVRRDVPALAAKFQNALFLATLQGALIGVAGFGGFLLIPLLGIPSDQSHAFATLFTAQCLLVAWDFPFRPLNSLLLAQQRFEFNYLSTGGAMVLSLGLAWFGLAHGWGLWSLIAAGAFQGLVKSISTLFSLARLGELRPLFSGIHCSGHGARQLLQEGSSFFSGTLFGTLTGMAQSTLLSRWFGLEGVAVWGVGSKAANLLFQLLSKFYESSFAGLSELYESGRRDLLLQRLAQLFAAVMGTACFAGAGVILLNGLFILLWTDSRLGWPVSCDVAVALWLVALCASRGLVEQTKILLLWRWIRLGPLTEFLAFLVLGTLLARFFSLPGFVFGFALSPLVLAGFLLWFGLRPMYSAARLTIVPPQGGSYLLSGGLVFLCSGLLMFRPASVPMRVGAAVFVLVIFLWFLLFRVRSWLAHSAPANHPHANP
jgi:O-antigen/teichoic acid export membrane protein